MTSFLISGSVAVDAGAITRALTIAEQRAIRHVIVTHTHMDHTTSLPFLVENIFGEVSEPVTIYCTRTVLGAVKRHLFNNDTWPDFSRIPNQLYPSVVFEVIEPEVPFVIAGVEGGDLEVTAVPVNHLVPTTGLLLRQGATSIVFTSDTGPTDRIWEVANDADDLSAVITECSFPNRLQAVADISLHHTPQSLATELHKLKPNVPVLLYHFKPPYLDELRAEVAATDTTHEVSELVQDETYEF
jgi:ribonuclease BN (tRNA processing enzyme)